MKISQTIAGVLVLSSVLAAGAVFAEDTTVSGQVVAGGVRSGLAGVDVAVVGSDQHTTTDHNGRYTLQAPANAKLRFSIEGMPGQEVMVDGQTEIDVTLGF
jgi:iron complex outermembrane receptor protein